MRANIQQRIAVRLREKRTAFIATPAYFSRDMGGEKPGVSDLSEQGPGDPPSKPPGVAPHRLPTVTAGLAAAAPGLPTVVAESKLLWCNHLRLARLSVAQRHLCSRHAFDGPYMGANHVPVSRTPCGVSRSKWTSPRGRAARCVSRQRRHGS
jgi:hypothetical protein